MTSSRFLWKQGFSLRFIIWNFVANHTGVYRSVDGRILHRNVELFTVWSDDRLGRVGVRFVLRNWRLERWAVTK